ncbi:MAG: hypothetical protein WC595_01095 [Candidatus Nanoarchaeia archaeon]
MVVSRREVLGVVGLAMSGVASVHAEGRPFLYSFDSFQRFGKYGKKFFLEGRSGETLFHVWRFNDALALNDVRETNRLYGQYRKNVEFVSVIESSSLPLDKTSSYAECVNKELRSEGVRSERFSRLFTNFLDGAPYSKELQGIVDNCEHVSSDLERKVEELKQKGDWPGFSVYVLDDSSTREYLHAERAPCVSLFLNGRYKKSFSLIKEVKRELEKK